MREPGLPSARTLAELRAFVVQELQQASVPEAEYDGTALLLAAFSMEKQKYLLHSRENPALLFSEKALREALWKLREMLKKRCGRIPLQQILGFQDFYGHRFLVGPAVLIPRPDTEILVEECRRYLSGGQSKFRSASFRSIQGETEAVPGKKRREAESSTERQRLSVLELGTGSGCIAVSLAAAACAGEITALDISEQALGIAGENALRIRREEGLEAVYRVVMGDGSFAPEGRASVSSEGERAEEQEKTVLRFLCSDLYSALPTSKSFNLIVSNPPYLRTGELGELDPEVREHDPLLALDGGEDGLCFYRRILAEASKYLKRDGAVFLEIGESQEEAVSELFRKAGFTEIECIRDFAGKSRVLKGVSHV